MNDLDRRLEESLKTVTAAVRESRSARAVGAHADFRRRLRRRRVTRFTTLAATAAVLSGVVAVAATQGAGLFERTEREPRVATPAGEYIGVGEEPIGVSVGGGVVWVASKGGTITHVDPTTNSSRRVINVGGEPADIALTPGRVWYSDAGDGSVKQLDTESGKFVGAPLSIGTQGVHIDVDVGPEGTVWAVSPDLGALVAIDSASGAELRRVLASSPVELGITAGSVWSLEDGGGTIVRYDFDTGGEALRVPIGDATKTDLAVTSSAVYVAEADGTILRIDPATGEVDRSATVSGENPELAVGAGALWVTSDEEGVDAELARLGLGDLNPLSKPQKFVAAPTDLALGQGAAWITDTGRDTVVRLKLPR